MTARLAVTIVIPTRDRQAWLTRCVESVLAQPDVAFEVIIVDDASTDGTAEWLPTITDRRVRSVRLGVPSERSVARNRGLADARAPLVMFLDDDDWLHVGALRTLVSALASHPEAIAAVGARRTWFTAEDYARRDSHPRVPRLRSIMDDLIVGWSAVSGQNLFRTALVREIGGFDPAFRPCEDRDLWLRLAAHGPVVLRPETTVTYCVHHGQWRPPDLRQIRERVARRAIRRLPRDERRHALRLRRTTVLIDRAEDDLTSGHLASGLAHAIRAAANSPGIFLSPLIGGWIVRRLAGRFARRFIWPAREARFPLGVPLELPPGSGP